MYPTRQLDYATQLFLRLCRVLSGDDASVEAKGDTVGYHIGVDAL
jgi:hypothetical protein